MYRRRLLASTQRRQASGRVAENTSPNNRFMSELSELYQQVILDHNKKPRNFHKIEAASHHAEGSNPLCGDQLTVYAELEDDTLKDVSFEGSGCAISKAAASMMTVAVKGKT